MEVYGAIPANGSSMSNGSTSGNTANTGGNQFMPNKYQFATYYGQKSMMNNVANGGAGSHFGQGGN